MPVCCPLPGEAVVVAVRGVPSPWQACDLPVLSQCGNMAREGLRTLVVAKRALTEEQYQDFEVSGQLPWGHCRWVGRASSLSRSSMTHSSTVIPRAATTRPS